MKIAGGLVKISIRLVKISDRLVKISDRLVKISTPAFRKSVQVCWLNLTVLNPTGLLTVAAMANHLQVTQR